MNTGTIIFVSILLLVIIIPVMIINSRKKKEEKQFLQNLNDLAGKNNCKITEYQLWNNIIIGADRESLQLFFIRKMADSEVNRQVKLTEIQKCHVVNLGRSVSSKDGNYQVTERIDLVFTPRNVNNSEMLFDIYNSKYDSLTLQGELQLAEKWAGIANSMLINFGNRM